MKEEKHIVKTLQLIFDATSLTILFRCLNVFRWAFFTYHIVASLRHTQGITSLQIQHTSTIFNQSQQNNMNQSLTMT